MASCRNCQKELSRDERAIYKRMVNKLAAEEELLCKHCLAEMFDVTVEKIDEKIEYFKSTGCTLFN